MDEIEDGCSGHFISLPSSTPYNNTLGVPPIISTHLVIQHDVHSCCVLCVYIFLPLTPTDVFRLASTAPAVAVQGRPTYARPPLFKQTAPPPSPVLEAAVKRFMARDARKIFEAHWEEAKKRFGAWNAGLTLKAFLEKNTKVRIMSVPYNEMLL